MSSKDHGENANFCQVIAGKREFRQRTMEKTLNSSKDRGREQILIKESQKKT